MQEKWNQDKLKNKIIQESLEAEVASKLDKESKHQIIQDRWEALRENILDSAKKKYRNYQTSEGKEDVDNRRND